MIVFRYYDEDEKIDYALYDSSSVRFSKCEDKENDFKELTVMFVGGASYVYHKVDVNDYIMFMHGGLDGSNGKAINKFIKPKYEYERVFDFGMENVIDIMEKCKQKKEEKEKKEAEEKNKCTHTSDAEK